TRCKLPQYHVNWELAHLHAFILQIPPKDSPTSLRTAFLVGELGHRVSTPHGRSPTAPRLSRRPADKAWLAILDSQVRDPSSGHGG
ncbi:hypothetical protein EV363DRAFT_1489081, partial [Boletus edulis]